jgi:hypothetical protein
MHLLSLLDELSLQVLDRFLRRFVLAAVLCVSVAQRCRFGRRGGENVELVQLDDAICSLAFDAVFMLTVVVLLDDWEAFCWDLLGLVDSLSLQEKLCVFQLTF